ncbi:MAG: transglycosylase family protein [Actinomycetota bacterium]
MRTVLTRPPMPGPSRVSAFVIVCAALLVPAPARAATTTEQIADVRARVDAAAERWFATQTRLGNLDAEITEHDHAVDAAQARIAEIRRLLAGRARLLYEGAAVGLTDAIGDTAIDSARRAHLIDKAGAFDAEAIARLDASVEDQSHPRDQLETARAERAAAADDLEDARRALDGHLAELRARADGEAAAARLLRERTSSGGSPSTAEPTGRPPVTPPPPGDPPSGGTHPHHDDPFLSCTRARESRGIYSIVSGDGLYHGAYQFLPSTWDATAAHAGRLDLVGVLPSRASVYDQDEMAWQLYQWQGTAPWGGRC